MQPIAENLFTRTSDGPRLIGSRAHDTGRVTFPYPQGPEGARYEEILLSGQGRLWSWTVQRFLPKTPPYRGVETLETFKPFILGYVELPGEVIVETRIVNAEAATLRIGQPMELTLQPFATTEGDREIYAFEPA